MLTDDEIYSLPHTEKKEKKKQYKMKDVFEGDIPKAKKDKIIKQKKN